MSSEDPIERTIRELPHLLSIGETANVLRVTERTVYARMRDKSIRATRLPNGRGGRTVVRIPRWSLAKLLRDGADLRKSRRRA